jgi:dienelactone hydrolase
MKFIIATAFLAAAVSAQAAIVTKTVPYEHNGVQLEGYLAYDDALTSQAKLPGVLIVHEWWGLDNYERVRAVQVAKLGYVAFAIDMYGKGVVTREAGKAAELCKPFYASQPLMAERAQAGLDALLRTGLVDDKRVAAIGFCFGGSTVQALAYSGAPLVGIVSFHGGLIPVPVDAAQKNHAKILICQGEPDPFVKQADRDAFRKSMDDGKFDYQFILYSGALHAFTNPEADELARANGLQGAIAYNAAAAHRSWAQMRVFLDEVFMPVNAVFSPDFK